MEFKMLRFVVEDAVATITLDYLKCCVLLWKMR